MRTNPNFSISIEKFDAGGFLIVLVKNGSMVKAHVVKSLPEIHEVVDEFLNTPDIIYVSFNEGK